MPWIDVIREKLKCEFGGNSFLASQATAVLQKDIPYSKETIRQAIHQLVKEGVLTRIGRGMYTFEPKRVLARDSISLSDSVAVIFTSGTLLEAEDLLKQKGIEYMVTGPSALTMYHQHLSRRLIHLIYVTKGAGEFACATLSEANLRTFVNPKRQQLDMMLDTLTERDLFVIREYSKLEGNINGRATVEKAIVDTYFESTRAKIPFSNVEVGRMIANAYAREKLSISQLLLFAGRHGIRREFQSILKALASDIPIPSGTTNEAARKVIAGIRSR